jgi:putative oxidoreductase
MMRDLTLFAARVLLGGSLAAHGAQKAFGWFEGPGPDGAAALFEKLGFRPGATFAAAGSWNEIVAGNLIALGLGGPLGPAMLISGMIVAMQSVHAKNGFFAAKNGIELPLLYSVAALALSGRYGRLSLDHMLGLDQKLEHPAVDTLALVGGVAAAFAMLSARNPAGEGSATPTFRGKNSPLPEPTSPG